MLRVPSVQPLPRTSSQNTNALRRRNQLKAGSDLHRPRTVGSLRISVGNNLGRNRGIFAEPHRNPSAESPVAQTTAEVPPEMRTNEARQFLRGRTTLAP